MQFARGFKRNIDNIVSFPGQSILLLEKNGIQEISVYVMQAQFRGVTKSF